MNEHASSAESEAPEGQPLQADAKDLSAGAILKLARENAGLHIAALAVSMKVPVKRLEALEAEKWELLPDAVFVRALASSVCRTLKIDAQPVLQRLPKPSVVSLPSHDQSINTPLMQRGPAVGGSVFEPLSRPTVLVALSLLIGAVVVIFFPSMERVENMVPPSVTEVFSSSVSTALPAPPAAIPQTQSADPKVTAESPSSVLPAVPVVDRAAVEAASSPSAASKNGLLVFKSRGSSWIEVTDSSNHTLLRRILESGEVIEVSGALPLSVVVGRADVIHVSLRGKPLDLENVSKANVARFEVK